MRRGAAVALGCVLAWVAAGASRVQAGGEQIAPQFTTHVIDRFGAEWPAGQTRGPLTFLGGLEIESDEAQFGSLSGAIELADGRVLAVSDTGLSWLIKVGVDAHGAPVGPVGAVGSPLLDERGLPFSSKDFADAEAITLAPDGRHAIVAFETHHRVLAYPLESEGGLAGPGQRVAMPEATRRLRYSKGLEAIATAPIDSPLAGALVAIGEQPSRLGSDPDLPGWCVGGPRDGAFHVVRLDQFDATDAAFLPSGDLLLLERRILLGDGLRMRIRRFRASEIVPGARLHGEIVLEAGARNAPIDNMEAIVVGSDPGSAGRQVRITMVSDNNRSILQRTLVLGFLLRVD